MDSDKKKLFALLEEIRELIEENENADGTFRFDPVTAMVALDFTKSEIKRSISRIQAQLFQTD